jgi:hypothetical protein
MPTTCPCNATAVGKHRDHKRAAHSIVSKIKMNFAIQHLEVDLKKFAEEGCSIDKRIDAL